MSVVPNWRENWIRKEKHFVVGKKNYITLWERCKGPQRGGVQKCYSHVHPVTWKQMSHCQGGGGWKWGCGMGVGREMLIPPLFFYFLKPKFGFLFGSRNRREQRMSHERFYCMSSFLENWTLVGPGTSWSSAWQRQGRRLCQRMACIPWPIFTAMRNWEYSAGVKYLPRM